MDPRRSVGDSEEEKISSPAWIQTPDRPVSHCTNYSAMACVTCIGVLLILKGKRDVRLSKAVCRVMCNGRHKIIVYIL
jgi:hypothetical protein